MQTQQTRTVVRKYTPRGPNKIQQFCTCCKARCTNTKSSICIGCGDRFCNKCMRWTQNPIPDPLLERFPYGWNSRNHVCLICLFRHSEKSEWDTNRYVYLHCAKKFGKYIKRMEKQVNTLQRYEDHFNICETCQELDKETFQALEALNTEEAQ